MKISERLQSITRVFLDTAPIIYAVEQHPRYVDLVRPALRRIDEGSLLAVTSPVTLAECLIAPYRQGRADVAQAFVDQVVYGNHVSFMAIEQKIAEQAADLRAPYNLLLPDSFQLAVAFSAGCDAFLTNDADLKRITEIDVLVLDELEPD